MPDCKLMPTCPYFNGEFQESPGMTSELKAEYCHDEYGRCGRYMLYKARVREMERTASGFTENVTKKQQKIRSLNLTADGFYFRQEVSDVQE